MRSFRWNGLARFFLIGFFLPLTFLLLLCPNSWGHAEEYEDWGIVEFEASALKSKDGDHLSAHYYVVYKATDGSGLTFRESAQYQKRQAEQDIAEHKRIQRHVYAAKKRSKILYLLFGDKTELRFLPPGTDLQKAIDPEWKLVVIVRGVGICYIAGYAAAAVLKKRARKNRESSS